MLGRRRGYHNGIHATVEQNRIDVPSSLNGILLADAIHCSLVCIAYRFEGVQSVEIAYQVLAPITRADYTYARPLKSHFRVGHLFHLLLVPIKICESHDNEPLLFLGDLGINRKRQDLRAGRLRERKITSLMPKKGKGLLKVQRLGIVDLCRNASATQIFSNCIAILNSQG